MDGWEHLRETWERIRWARYNAKFERAVDAAESLGIKPGTYRTYERGVDDGGRVPPIKEGQKLAKKFKVNWVWLLSGQGKPTDTEEENPRIQEIARRVSEIPADKRDDALNAVEAVILSFTRKAV